MSGWMKWVAVACGFVLALFVSTAWGAPGAGLPGVALKSYQASIGAPVTVGNLTVFPVYAKENAAFKDAISLEQALEQKKARVREVGEGDDGGGASVGTLMIDNLGDKPVFVLAGTVVKGGKQDRQIAQDFVLAAKDSADVEAFCVEQGRWTTQRQGKNTGGNFSASGMIAPQKVRIAAQYKSKQSEVWDEVAKTNKKSKKAAKSGTLMATYDAKDVVAKRKALAKKVQGKLAKAPSEGAVLGIAYAIDGKVKGVRWFGSRGLFEAYRRQLLETAAVEAILAPQTEAKPKPPTAKGVRDFIEGVARTKVKAKMKRAKTMNTLHKRESKAAYSSEAVLDSESEPLSVDVSAKE